MLSLYNTLALAAKPFALGWAAWRGRDPERALECAQRTTRALPQPLSGSIWLHGASVGEARVVSSLAAMLRERFPTHPQALSALTASGLRQLPDSETQFILPFDFSGYPTRLLARLDPRLLLLVETELWPNLIHEAAAANVPIALASARLAPERMARYRRWSSLYRPLLKRIEVIGAQTSEDAARFESLGAPARAIRVTGNLKYDLSTPEIPRNELDRRLGNWADRPIWVAGSTRPGEEPIVLEAFEMLRRSFPDLLLILAPRHLKRVDEVLELSKASGRAVAWSALDGPTESTPDIVVIDTLGQLASIYAVAKIAFVGGSLQPYGGHSPLEPAAAGVPVLIGPHSDHVAEPVRRLVAVGGARQVTDAVDLSAAASVWLADRELQGKAAQAARGMIEAHVGALRLTLDAIEPVIERGAV